MAKIDLGRIVGKSAYEVAVEGGYQGTEEDFNKILVTIPEINKIREITLTNTSETTFNVDASGITQNDSPELYVKTIHLSSIEEKQAVQVEFAKIVEATTQEGHINFLLKEPLSQSIIVYIKGK